jgi:hypothetical protein
MSVAASTALAHIQLSLPARVGLTFHPYDERFEQPTQTQNPDNRRSRFGLPVLTGFEVIKTLTNHWRPFLTPRAVPVEQTNLTHISTGRRVLLPRRLQNVPIATPFHHPTE